MEFISETPETRREHYIIYLRVLFLLFCFLVFFFVCFFVFLFFCILNTLNSFVFSHFCACSMLAI